MTYSCNYVFESLPHITEAIRLMTALPGNRGDDIRCELRPALGGSSLLLGRA